MMPRWRPVIARAASPAYHLLFFFIFIFIEKKKEEVICVFGFFFFGFLVFFWDFFGFSKSISPPLRAFICRHEDIDVVVLSHLHFDHAGGLLAPWAPDTAPGLLFPKARFVVSAEAWARARRPHQRDRASFIAALPRLLESSGRLTVVQGPGVPGCLGAGYRLHYSQGHTPGLMLTEVEMPGGPVVFCGDLIPGTPWVHLPITMGYDRYPELLIDEKEQILGDLLRRGGRLFYTHDTHVAMSGLAQDGNGRYQATDPLAEVIGLQD